MEYQPDIVGVKVKGRSSVSVGWHLAGITECDLISYGRWRSVSELCARFTWLRSYSFCTFSSILFFANALFKLFLSCVARVDFNVPMKNGVITSNQRYVILTDW